MNDNYWMSQAIELAAAGLYTTDPNPHVGCVIVKNNQRIAMGTHQQAGLPHAEVFALRQAGLEAKDATLYVTLEPCCHHGLTPPCVEQVIAAQVARVVVAMVDPNPKVATNGIALLQKNGISVDVGELKSSAVALNPGFVSRMQRGRPFVRLKLAMSVDGRTAMASGESQWITGPDSRQQVQRLRARSSAIISGIDTVLQDNCRLTVRPTDWVDDYPQVKQPFISLLANGKLKKGASPANASQLNGFVRHPLRVILDSSLRLPLNHPIIDQPGDTLVVVREDLVNTLITQQKISKLVAKGLTIWKLPVVTGQQSLDLHVLLQRLAEIGCNEVLVESGATLAGSFIQAGLVDELWLYQGSSLLGSSAKPLLQFTVDQLSEKIVLKLLDMRSLGNDVRFIYQLEIAQEQVNSDQESLLRELQHCDAAERFRLFI